MFCTKCGKQLDDDMKFCTACGAPVAALQRKPIAEEAEPEKAAEGKVATAEEEVAPASPEAVVDVEGTKSGENDETADGTEASHPDRRPETATEGSIGIEQTAVLVADEIEVTNAGTASTDKPFDLPDSALEPSTPDPEREASPERKSSDETAVMPVVGVAAAKAYEAQNPNAGEMPQEPSPKKTRQKAIIGICSAAAAVIIAAIGVLVVLDPFNPNTSIDSDAFPNDVIRGAVLDQLDEDGDGRLSNEEAQLVTALVLTPEGAEFVTEGNEVDVRSIRESIKQQHADSGDGGVEQSGNDPGSSANGDSQGQAGDGSSDVQAQGLDGKQDDRENDVGEELSVFPNIKTFIASDCGLTTIDLSKMPELEYVDLRQNPSLRTFDLANNKKIKVLFCDEGTDITGLDDAGLYFTDLVTGMQVGHGNFSYSYTLEYDTHARLTSVTEGNPNGSKETTLYSYDDYGRLAHVGQSGEGASGWYEAYAYGDNGLLSNASVFWALDVSAKVTEYAYGYDAEGRLTQFALGSSEKGSDTKVFEEAGTFIYHDGSLAAFKNTDSATTFSIDDNGLLAGACIDQSSSQTSIGCTYGTSGALSSYATSYASLDGSASMNSFTTDYSEAGLPLKSTVPDGLTNMEVVYGSNADGYINSIQWGGSDAFMAGSTGKLSYVKRVGSLAERESERYVPVVRPSLYVTELYDMQGWSPLQNWFSSTGAELPITMLVEGPMTVAKEQLGTQSTMLLNPNELKLFEYGRKNWTDGLSLGAEQPIKAAGVTELLAKSADTPLPVQAQSFLDDPVYGDVVKQYLNAQKDANAGISGPFEDDSSVYSFIPDSIKIMYYYTAQASTRSSSSKDKTIDFAYIDLNSDGTNELVVAFPYMVSNTTTHGNSSVCAAVYGQADGKPVLIANGAERLQCWISAEGNVITYGGGSLYGEEMVYSWDGTKAFKSGGISYDKASIDESDEWNVTIYLADGSEKKSIVPFSAITQKMKELDDSESHAQLNWVPIPVS